MRDTSLSVRLVELFDFWGVEHEEHKRVLSLLIQTNEDRKEFMNYFYSGYIIKDMVNYQNHKRISLNIGFEEFDNMYEQDKLTSIETLFQEPLVEDDISLLETYEVSHIELFERFKQDPRCSYFEIVKTKRREAKVYSDDFLIVY